MTGTPTPLAKTSHAKAAGAGESRDMDTFPHKPVDAAVRSILSRHLRPSRLIRADWLSTAAAADVFFKLESELPTGSFKVRGALYALSVNVERRSVREVVASSTGNHGAAVAYAAKQFGVRATIFPPRDSNPVKRAKIAALGAAISERGLDLDEAFEAAAEYSLRSGAFFLNDATDSDIPAGAGTISDVKGWSAVRSVFPGAVHGLPLVVGSSRQGDRVWA
jgi:threonine dehydratase